MFFLSEDLMRRLMEERSRQILLEIEQREMLRQAQVDKGGGSYHSLCALLRGVGRLLVAIGRRLERYGRVGPASPAGQRMG